MTLDTPLVGGGGGQGCGGTRPNAGRKSTIKSQVDWKMYKKIGKKESQDLKKKHKSIDLFFTKASKDSIDSSNQIDDAVPVKAESHPENFGRVSWSDLINLEVPSLKNLETTSEYKTLELHVRFGIWFNSEPKL